MLAGLTQPEFAEALERVGVPASYFQVGKWETGRTVLPVYVMVGAARVAELSLDELLGVAGSAIDELRHQLELHEERITAVERAIVAIRARANGSPAGETSAEPEDLGPSA